MTAALIALGSNLGDRRANLDRAVQLVAARPGVHLLAASDFHATQPVGGPAGQADFLNAAALFETSLDAAAFFAAMRDVETTLGRQRDGPRWSPRSIDLDLLLHGSLVVESADLTVPHRRMAFRRFVIEPAAEVAPTMMHPTIGWTLIELRDHLQSAPPYVAIAGAPGAGKSQLAAHVSRSLGARLLQDPAGLRVDSAHPSGSSGLPWKSEIELLQLRTSQLGTAISPGKDDRGTALSDYWFDQSLCFAPWAVPPARLAEYGRHWQTAALSVPRAKLLVLLDAPVELLWHRVEAIERRPAWLDLESFAQLRQAIVDRALAPGRGPLLRLDSRQPETARIELAAAIEAMG
jgi:2-amino-4-hydroxy-6-hydroxymethyldihydropteridine diphosphokinase